MADELETPTAIANLLTVEQRACVIALADAAGYDISHEDEIVAQFCDEDAETDTFNSCHELGLLRSTHNSDSGESWVIGTALGREVRATLLTASDVSPAKPADVS